MGLSRDYHAKSGRLSVGRNPVRLLWHLSWVLSVFMVLPLYAMEPCRIDIVEEGTGWPVPLVELRTTHNVRFVSDNAGVIAFDLPELMGVETWFTVEGHGYGVAPDNFGFKGVRLLPEPGKRLTVSVKRALLGKRLGRLTGGGLYGESQQLGLEQDWREQGILGCDSVLTAIHDGKLFWIWGDTSVAGYPLGLFHVLSATTAVQPLTTFEPPLSLPYVYFSDANGKPRNVAQLPGEGPTWLSGFISLPDKSGRQRLVACYVKVKPPMEAYEKGLCVWNEEAEAFERTLVLWEKTDENPNPSLNPDGHPTFWTDDDGKEWLLFGDPFPHFKCAPSFEAWADPTQWQALEPQESVPSASGEESVVPHRGSIAWNAYRGKWVAVFTQMGGESSVLGEIWYAEADAPTGPWGNAVKVVTHEKYTLYNPLLHPEFTTPDSPILLFEGTYTKMFSGNQEATPRYEYNQILYRLDLDDPALCPK